MFSSCYGGNLFSIFVINNSRILRILKLVHFLYLLCLDGVLTLKKLLLSKSTWRLKMWTLEPTPWLVGLRSTSPPSIMPSRASAASQRLSKRRNGVKLRNICAWRAAPMLRGASWMICM